MTTFADVQRRWTVLTVVMLVLLLGSLLNTVWALSVGSLAGFFVMLVITLWVLNGCADRGDPLAQRILSR